MSEGAPRSPHLARQERKELSELMAGLIPDASAVICGCPSEIYRLASGPDHMSLLLCYDGSESAKHAIWTSHATLGHRSLTLLHVWHPPARVLADAFGASITAETPSGEELDRWARARAREVLREGEELALKLGFAVEGRAERSETATWRTILAVADQIDAKLIVLGTHGTTAVQSGLLGSVSAAVISHSERPVLVVPTPQAD